MADLFNAAQMASVSHFPASLRVPALQFAQSLPVGLDLFCMLMCFIAAIPLGFVHARLPSATVKHVYSTVLGLAFGYLLVGGGVLHSLATCLVSYAAAGLLPASVSPTFTWIFSMAYLSWGHIDRMSLDDKYWSLEFTMFQMVMTAKQIMFVCNIADGAVLKAEAKSPAEGGKSAISAFQKQRALTVMPSPLEYMSYMFFFGGLIVGPAFEMREYLDFTDKTVFRKDKFTSIPSRVLPVLKSLGWIAFSFLGMELSKKFPIGYTQTEEYLHHSLLGSTLLWRILYQFVAVTLSRFKYYFVWNLAEAGCIASGLGYAGMDAKTGAVRWDSVSNIDFQLVECSGTMTDLTTGWNKRINHWLKEYIFKRTTVPSFLASFIGQRTWQLVMTRATSAFWHGFYAGYYLMFFNAIFSNMVDDTYHRLARPFFFNEKTTEDATTGRKTTVSTAKWSAPIMFVYHFLAFAQVHLLLNYFAAAFVLLDLDKALVAWQSIYFAGHVFVVLVLAAGALVRKPKSDRAPKAAQNPVAAAATAAVAAAAEPSAEASQPAESAARLASPARRRSTRAD